VGAAHLAVDDQQYWPLPQLLVCPWMQPPAVIVQVRTEVSPAQVVPVDDPHPPVGAGQLQPADGKLPAQTWPPAQLVLAAPRQPLAVAQVMRVPLPSQYDPAPAWQAETAGHAQPAAVALPLQTCGAAQVLVAVWTRQPDTVAQVTTVAPSEAQVVPAPAAHTDGTAGQAQEAAGKLPPQAVGASQVLTAVLLRQPFASSAQVSSCPPDVQSRPAAVHSAGGAGHAPQLAAPAAPVQPWPQAVLPVITRHCAASSAQVTTLPEPSQYVPALPAHTAGAVGQVQAACGNAPPHGSFEAQAALVV